MSITSLCMVVLLAIGHAEVQAAVINRIHGFALPDWLLKATRHFHDFAVLLFPVVLFVAVGLGPEWLRDERWSDATLGWKIVGVVCGLGLLSLLVSIVRWQTRRPAVTEIASTSHVVDYRKQLGSRSLGSGPHRWVTGIPFNEAREVEFQQLHFQCERLPDAWDGMSILHLSDFHLIGTLSLEFFRNVCAEVNREQYDLVVFTGDLFDDDTLTSWLPETLGTFQAKLGRYFILGNHDERRNSSEIRDAITQLGWCDVSGTVRVVNYLECQLEIAGTERPWMGEHPSLSRTSPSAFRILLSHTPDNYRWAQRHHVDVMLSGHNHGGQVILPVIGPVYAPSLYGVRYSAGSWYQAPTLLHVSRGLSGEIPLRWNCRPAITKLVLHSAAKNKAC